VRSLTKLVTEEISLELSVEDFKTFFKVKQKKHSHHLMADIWVIIRPYLRISEERIMQ